MTISPPPPPFDSAPDTGSVAVLSDFERRMRKQERCNRDTLEMVRATQAEVHVIGRAVAEMSDATKAARKRNPQGLMRPLVILLFLGGCNLSSPQLKEPEGPCETCSCATEGRPIPFCIDGEPVCWPEEDLRCPHD